MRHDIWLLVLLSVFAPVVALFLTSTANAIATPFHASENPTRSIHFLNGPDLAILSFLQYFAIIALAKLDNVPWKASFLIPAAAVICLLVTLSDKQHRKGRWKDAAENDRVRHVAVNNLVGSVPLIGVTIMLIVLPPGALP